MSAAHTYRYREFGSVNISDIEMSGIAEAVRTEMADEGTSMKVMNKWMSRFYYCHEVCCTS